MAPERVHYLDWLKVLIVYGICVFHASLVFSAGTWLVSNSDRSLLLTAFAGFCFPWGIPALFLIAGADAWFGLRSHSVAAFLRGRFLRLLVPMGAGLILISPFQRFVTSANPPPPLTRLWPAYMGFFRAFHFEWTLQLVSRYWLHLWFLGYLFAISLACLPVLLWLRGRVGRRAVSEVVAVAGRPGGLLLLALPLCVLQSLLRPAFPAYQDWADIVTYTLAFAWGAIVISDRRFEAPIRRAIGWNLVVGTCAVVGVGVLTFLAPGYQPEGVRVPFALRELYAIFWALDVWCWLHALLWLGISRLDLPEPGHHLCPGVSDALLRDPPPAAPARRFLCRDMEPSRMAEVRDHRNQRFRADTGRLRARRAPLDAEPAALRPQAAAPIPTGDDAPPSPVGERGLRAASSRDRSGPPEWPRR